MSESNGTAVAALALPFSAAYKSPANEPFTYTEPIAAPPSSSVHDKKDYLKSLRKAINSAQESINKELTARMEEDKAREAGKNGLKTTAVDEALEEENYGEEAPPNDD